MELSSIAKQATKEIVSWSEDGTWEVAESEDSGKMDHYITESSQVAHKTLEM